MIRNGLMLSTQSEIGIELNNVSKRKKTERTGILDMKIAKECVVY